MPTFRAMWAVRKQTFAKVQLESPIFIGLGLLFCILVIDLIATVMVTGIASAFTEDGMVLSLVAIASFGIFFIFLSLSYGAVIFKRSCDWSHGDSGRWERKLDQVSLENRLRLPLAIMGLKLDVSTTETKLFDRATSKTIDEVTIYTADYPHDSSLSVRAYKLIGVDEHSLYAGLQKHTKIEWLPLNPFAKVRFYVWFKALAFIAVKLLTFKKTPEGYAGVFFRSNSESYYAIRQGMKLGLDSEKLATFIRLDVPVEEYETFKDLPISWVEKSLQVFA